MIRIVGIGRSLVRRGFLRVAGMHSPIASTALYCMNHLKKEFMVERVYYLNLTILWPFRKTTNNLFYSAKTIIA